MTDTERFWETLSLNDLSDEQWESLCDGCGRCCLQKLEDSDTGEIHFTSIACHLLDLQTCRCQSYRDRFKLVPDCTSVRPLNKEKLQWLPVTCAYRLVAEGKSLPEWHPLVSGTPASVVEAGISIRPFAVDEKSVELQRYPEFIIKLVDQE